MEPATPLPSRLRVMAANDLIIPKLDVLYRRAESEFTSSGIAVVDRSLSKGSLGGERASNLLFLPAGILAFGKNTEVLLDLFEVTTEVPWLHWTLMEAIKGFRCLLLRRLEWERNDRASEVRNCAVYRRTSDEWADPKGGLFASTAQRRGQPDYARFAVEHFTAAAATPPSGGRPLSQGALSNHITRMYLLAELVAYLKADPATQTEAIPHSAAITAGGKPLAYLLSQPLIT